MNRKIFISGHCNITHEEFDNHYKPKLDEIISNPIHNILIGNARGADTLALDYLIFNNYPKELITIYFYSPYNCSMNKYEGLNIVNGFTSYTKRDSEMTKLSTEDLLWIRSDEDNKIMLESMGMVYIKKRKSGTELNLIRRLNKKT
jgi:hypothetical protein